MYAERAVICKKSEKTERVLSLEINKISQSELDNRR